LNRFLEKNILLPLSQIIRRFSISRFIAFTMYLDINISRCVTKAMNLEKSKRLIIWNGGSTIHKFK
jgi:hypothetical protein